MTPDDTVDLLTECATYDQRTVGETDVRAWYKAIGHLDRDDALAAVARHYGRTRERIMPADIAQLVREIRIERQARQPHESRALPGACEDDTDRRDRGKRGATLCRKVLASVGIGQPQDDQVLDPTNPARDAALRRARTERSTTA